MTLVQDARQAVAINQEPQFWQAAFASMTVDEARAEAQEMKLTYRQYAETTYDGLQSVGFDLGPKDEWVDAVTIVLEARIVASMVQELVANHEASRGRA